MKDALQRVRVQGVTSHNNLFSQQYLSAIDINVKKVRLQQIPLTTRQHSSRMRTARLPTIRVSMAITKGLVGLGRRGRSSSEQV